MKRMLLALAMLMAGSGSTTAQTLPPLIADVAFLIGDWHGDGGSKAGLINHGTSSIHLIVGGNALLRRDHTDVTDKAGKLQQSFDQYMLIYPEGGALHADYVDGAQVIHYTSTEIKPGEEVSFRAKAASPLEPDVRLTYRKTGPDTLSVLFQTHPPGAPYMTVTSGMLTRD